MDSYTVNMKTVAVKGTVIGGLSWTWSSFFRLKKSRIDYDSIESFNSLALKFFYKGFLNSFSNSGSISVYISEVRNSNILRDLY